MRWNWKTNYFRIFAKMFWHWNWRLSFELSRLGLNDKSREQVVKDALSSSTRAISQKKDLEITFGLDSLSGNSIPKVSSSKKDLVASRGKADKIALKEKYSFEKPNKITGIQELDQILFEQNDIRLDILGSLQFAGVKKNLHKNFLDSLFYFKLYWGFLPFCQAPVF